MTRPLHDEYQPGHEGGSRPVSNLSLEDEVRIASIRSHYAAERLRMRDQLVSELQPQIVSGPIMFLLGAFVTSLLWAGALLLRAAGII